MPKSTINPRLTKALKSKRSIAYQLQAFKRLEETLSPFHKSTQRRALKAYSALIEDK